MATMTKQERQTLSHIPLSEAGVALGVIMHLTGLGMLLGSGSIGVALGLLSLGAGLAAISGYYWGCRNNACMEDS